MSPKKSRPEISIEWLDVSIDIKVCGVDIPPEDRGYVRLFPDLDNRLVTREQIDANKHLFRKERKKLQKYEYTLLPSNSNNESTAKVLPKLMCNHCGKSFSRRSTLEQHIASHDRNNSSWEDVQDAALQDLEHAIVFGGGGTVVKGGAGREDLDLSREEGEEEEIPAPQGAWFTQLDSEFRCNKCFKSFNKMSLLKKHMKIHSGIKPYACEVCGWRFLQRYSLKKHMWTHSIEKPNKCIECHAAFSDPSTLRAHVLKFHNQEELDFISADHNPPQLIQCPQCDRKFAAKAHLDRHLPVHNNMAKPYECDICGWKFHLLHNMERHRATHNRKGKKAKIPPHKRFKRKYKKRKGKESKGNKEDDDDELDNEEKDDKEEQDGKEEQSEGEDNLDRSKDDEGESEDEDDELKSSDPVEPEHDSVVNEEDSKIKESNLGEEETKEEKDEKN